MISVSTET